MTNASTKAARLGLRGGADRKAQLTAADVARGARMDVAANRELTLQRVALITSPGNCLR